MQRAFGALSLSTALLLCAGAAIGNDGFYVRLDGGATFTSRTEYKDTEGCNSPNAAVGCGGAHDRGAASYVLSGGVGYHFEPWLRGDITFSYRPDIDSNLVGDSNPNNVARSDTSSLSGMINGYIEFAGFYPETFAAIKPYIGLGVGVARNHSGVVTLSVKSSELDYFEMSGRSTLNLAWTAMAGAAVPVLDNVLVDIGYRYVDLGTLAYGAAAGCYINVSSACQSVNRVERDLTSHEMIVGVRVGF